MLPMRYFIVISAAFVDIVVMGAVGVVVLDAFLHRFRRGRP